MSTSGNFPLTFRLQVQGDAEIASKFKNVATSMNQITPAAQKVAQGSKQAETALKSTGQAATQSSTGLKSYGGALTSLGSANTQARSSTDAFSGSLTNFSKVNTAAVGGLNETNTVTKGLVPTMGSLDSQSTKTGGAMQRLTDVFRGNRGLIFSVTMLGSGITEAIGMYQGWTDASDKLAAAKEKEADLLARGMEHTKEYGDAVNEVADAQRGYNFITRFTIQSFGDLVPMALMLSSSMLEMTGKIGGLSAAKTKLAAAGSKLVGVLTTIGSALMTFTTRHPLLAMLTLASAAVLALIKNFMGFRDAVNGVGVALGNAISPLKGILEYLGLQGNAVLDTADSYLTFGETALAATTDVEKQVLKTGDATKLSYNEQIALMAKLGEEGKTISTSLGMHLKQQQQDQQAHATKYGQFVSALQTGNADIMQSLGLTGDEFKAFSEQFQQETEALDEKFGTAVESIIGNWQRVNDGFGESVNSTVGEIVKLEQKITELTNQQWELDDKKELQKNREEIAKNQAKINELRGTTGIALGQMGGLFSIFGNDVQTAMGQKISPAMEEAGRDFIALGDAAKQGLDSIKLGILSQDFAGAINGLSTAIDSVPERYRSNFAQIDATIGNTALNNRQKVAQIVADYGSLEQAFKPLINGAYELSLAQAQTASGLDELSVAARANMTDMNQAGTAWSNFVNSLKPAQRDLPIIQDLMARLQAGTINHAQALQEAEAAGVAWSRTMGTDVMTSIKNVEKQFIDLGNGTSAMVANVNGSMVNLGTVSNTELSKLSDDLGGAQTSMSDTSTTANTALANEAPSAIGTMQSEFETNAGKIGTTMGNINLGFIGTGKNAETHVAGTAVTSVESLGTAMENTSTTANTETGNWTTAISNFAKSAKESIQGVIDQFGKMWEKQTGQPVGKDNPAVKQKGPARGPGEATIDPTSFGAGGAGATIATSAGMFDSMIKQLYLVDLAIKQVHTSFSVFSTSLATYSTSMTTNLGAFMTKTIQGFTLLDQGVKLHQQSWSIFSTSLATYATSMTTNLGAFFTKIGAAFPLLDQAVKLHQQSWSTFSTSVSTYAGSMTTNLGNFFTKIGQAFGLLDQAIKIHHQSWSTFSTSVSTYANSMATNIGSFATKTVSSFNTVNTAVKGAHTALSSMSTSVSTYMSSMSSKVNSFGSAAQSSFSKVASSANQATSAVKQLQSAINALKDKTITIRVNLAGPGVNHLQHGGSFLTHAQSGFSGIVNRPQKVGGVTMGESFKPELVTVMPLTRGTGNHTGPTMSSSSGGGSSRPIVIENIIMLDNQVIDRRIRKVALDSIGLQV